MYKVGLISIKDNSGCTSIGIHLANYLSNSLSVALVENKRKDEFSTIKACFEDDNTFYLNNVHFIPSISNYIPTEDIVIDVYGTVNFMDELNEKYNKICMLITGDVSNIGDVAEYVKETGTNVNLVLLGASKEQYDFYTSMGYKCIIVPDKKENILPYSLATYFSIELRKAGINPPKYNKNAIYEDIIWNYVPEEESSKKNLNVFGLFSSKKNKTEKIKEEDPAIDTKQDFVEQTDEEDYSSKVLQKGSGELEDEFSFVEVPTPKEIPAPDQPTDKPLEKEISNRKDSKNEEKPVVDMSVVAAEKKKYQKEIESVKKKADAEKRQQEKLLTESKKELEKAKKQAEEIQYKATHDKLCGTYNRTAFEENSKEFKRYGLVMFDVNELKKQNDSLGHKAGDKLLKTIAKILMKNIPEVYRYGGDEFVGIFRGLSNRDIDKITKILESIDEELSVITKKDKKITYSVARGVSFSSEGKLDTVLELADSRMYEHKKSLKMTRDDTPVEVEIKKDINVEENEPKQKKKSIFDSLRIKDPTIKANDVSRLNIFVTGISHSVGTSFVAGSISSALTYIYNKEVWVDFYDKNCDDVDNYMVKSVSSDEDRFNAFKSSFFVQDKGVYSLLTDNDMADMLRADINIMVSTAKENDLKDIAAFIKQNQEIIGNWVFAFNHVTNNQEKIIEKAMKNYNYIIIPFHDNAEIKDDLKNMYINLINEFTR